jgi:hypothetical protein
MLFTFCGSHAVIQGRQVLQHTNNEKELHNVDPSYPLLRNSGFGKNQ